MTECCVDKSCTPDGRTCSECFHFNRCAYVFNKTALDNTCVYSPRGYEEEISLDEFLQAIHELEENQVVVGDLVTWIEKIQQQRRDDNGK